MTPQQQDKLAKKLALDADELAELEELDIVFPEQLRTCDPDDLSSGLRSKLARYLPEQNGGD